MFEVIFYGDEIVCVRDALRHEFDSYDEAKSFIFSAQDEAVENGAYEVALTCRDETVWMDLNDIDD